MADFTDGWWNLPRGRAPEEEWVWRRPFARNPYPLTVKPTLMVT
jgi:hypothetical protein